MQAQTAHLEKHTNTASGINREHVRKIIIKKTGIGSRIEQYVKKNL